MPLWIIATLTAFFVKGLCGFANTLVFTGILSFGVDNVDISPVELLLGFPANALLLFRERRAIQWRLCLPLAGLVILGIIPGALFLKTGSAAAVKLLCGAAILLMGAQMLLREIKAAPRRAPSKGMLLGVGIASGLLSGMFGIGALMSALISRVTDDSHAFKANICAVFFCENVFRLGLYAAWGIITPAALRQWALLLPVALAGLGLGMLAARFLNERRARLAVIAALIASGAALIVNSL